MIAKKTLAVWLAKSLAAVLVAGIAAVLVANLSSADDDVPEVADVPEAEVPADASTTTSTTTSTAPCNAGEAIPAWQRAGQVSCVSYDDGPDAEATSLAYRVKIDLMFVRCQSGGRWYDAHQEAYVNTNSRNPDIVAAEICADFTAPSTSTTTSASTSTSTTTTTSTSTTTTSTTSTSTSLPEPETRVVMPSDSNGWQQASTGDEAHPTIRYFYRHLSGGQHQFRCLPQNVLIRKSASRVPVPEGAGIRDEVDYHLDTYIANLLRHCKDHHDTG